MFEDKEDEPSINVILTLHQINALIIGIPEMIAGCEFRLKLFNGAKPEDLMVKYNKTKPQAEQMIIENIALCKSLLDELPEIIEELREAHSLLEEKEEKNKTIITDLSEQWPPKNPSK